MKTIKHKNTSKSLLLILILTITVGCNQHSKYQEDLAISEYESSVEVDDHENLKEKDSPRKDLSNTNPDGIKLIRNVKARYKVKNIMEATENLKKLAISHQGYVSDLRYEQTLYKKENSMTFKIPNQQFDKMLDTMPSFAEFVDFETVSTINVTEEYIDLESRLQTKMEVKKRYDEILKKSAVTVEDILLTEDKMRVLQEEIESAQGRLNYLSNRVAFSTIDIVIYEEVEVKDEPVMYTKSFWARAKNGLRFGWDFVELVVLGMIHIWPFLVIGALLFVGIRFRKSKNS